MIFKKYIKEKLEKNRRKTIKRKRKIVKKKKRTKKMKEKTNLKYLKKMIDFIGFFI